MNHATNTAKKAARFRPRASVETVSETGGGRGEAGAWPGSPDTSDLEDTPLNPAPSAAPASPAKLRWKKVTKNLDTDSKKKEVSIKLS